MTDRALGRSSWTWRGPSLVVAASAVLCGVPFLVKAQPDGGEGTIAPLRVAARVIAADTNARAPEVTGLLVGERWGCVSYKSSTGSSWQCWESGVAPRARRVPWMDGQQFQSAPEHLCSFKTPEMVFRCWDRPVPGETSSRSSANGSEWLNPHHAHWDDAYSRADRVGTVEIGGTFSCLQTTKDSGVFCVGDDSFGQLGSSSPPTAQTASSDPAFVQGIWPAQFIALGTWHACAFAAPKGMAAGGHVACWGRGDQGQLGAAAPDLCRRKNGRSIPCARRPVKAVEISSEGSMMALGAGDLFTCLTDRHGISCWGANRDGFFGTPASCPPELRRAWPTLKGPVPAPRAACSAKPVPLAGVSAFSPDFRVYPRGVCFSGDAGPTCIGGIAMPKGEMVTAMSPSPGADASACGMRGGATVCWGEAYVSGTGALDVPVTVTLEPVSPGRETAVVRTSGAAGTWDDACLARKGCIVTPAPLPRCAPAKAAPTWHKLLSRAATFTGKVVQVRGPLGVGAWFTTMAGCLSKNGKRSCCNNTGAPVLLGGASTPLALKGLTCGGDDSQSCCNAPAYGQEVVASGRLEPIADSYGDDNPRWILVDAKLCRNGP